MATAIFIAGILIAEALGSPVPNDRIDTFAGILLAFVCYDLLTLIKR